MGADAGGALDGVLVLDLSRMLPGAVLVRQLVDLGARVVKVEDPVTGDVLRLVPPLTGEVGAGFAAFFRGVESVALDLRQADGAAAIRRLAKRADVLIESYRPGVMTRWGLGAEELREANPSLVVCSIPGYDPDGPCAAEVGHDLNFVARSGLLEQLGSAGAVPMVQLADFTAGLLAVSAVLAALLERGRTGEGAVITIPLARAPLPWLTWAVANDDAGDTGIVRSLLGGGVPCYRVYTCGDGRRVALGALEPKFWAGFVALLGLDHLAGTGLDPGEAGAAAAEEVARALASAPAERWAARAREAGLPLTVVATLEEALTDPCVTAERETVRCPGGVELRIPGPWLPVRPPGPRRVPALGQHTDEVLREAEAR